MITAAVIDCMTLIFGGLLDLLPVTEVPEWVNTGANYIPQVFNFAGSMGVWFPWGVLAVVVASVAAVWIGSFGLKVVRICISHVTGGGGSAA